MPWGWVRATPAVFGMGFPRDPERVVRAPRTVRPLQVETAGGFVSGGGGAAFYLRLLPAIPARGQAMSALLTKRKAL